jgi:sortase (surface protein transpeptidase)
MKKSLFAVALAVWLVWVGLATPSGIASQGCPERPVSHQALLTIPRIHMRNQPVANELTSGADLATGPVWDPYYPARPGGGKTMVIDAHDVTPVRCYGGHGPFYNLITIRRGDLARIKWAGVWRTYRFVTRPFVARQCVSKRINDSPAHLIYGTALCAPYNRPIKKRAAEVIYFRCCWPRYTRRNFLYERAVLVKPKH